VAFQSSLGETFNLTARTQGLCVIRVSDISLVRQHIQVKENDGAVSSALKLHDESFAVRE
jgi:hypothetical protein